MHRHLISLLHLPETHCDYVVSRYMTDLNPKSSMFNTSAIASVPTQDNYIQNLHKNPTSSDSNHRVYC